MKFRVSHLFPMLAVSVLTMAGVQSVTPKADPRIGMKAPDFTLPDTVGRTAKISDWKGKIVVLDFWATWCSPCREQLPVLARLARELANNNVVVAAINAMETPEQVRAFLQQTTAFSLRTILTFTDVSVLDKYKVSAYPTTFFIDPDGYVADVDIGFTKGSEQKIRDTISRISAPGYTRPAAYPATPATEERIQGVVYSDPETFPAPPGPEFAEDYLVRASLNNRMRQFDAALNDIDAALKRHPDWPPAVRLRSAVHAAQGNEDEQLKDYAELIRLLPNDGSVYETRARVFERKGKPAEAIKDYSRAIETNPLSVPARLGRGTCLFRDGDYENALSDFSAAANADPQNIGVYQNRAKVLDRMGRWEEELKDIDRILLALPTDAKTLQLRKDVVRRLAVEKEPARMARDDMYQVYSAVLLHPIWNHAEEAKMYLIQRTSTGSTYNSRPPGGCVQPPPRYEKMFEEILEDYRKHAGETVTLEPEFRIPTPYKLLSALEVKEFETYRFSGKMPETTNAALYGVATDIIRLGPVLFNHDHTMAMVLVSNYCGGLCGGEKWRILMKVRSSWVELDDWVTCVTVS